MGQYAGNGYELVLKAHFNAHDGGDVVADGVRSRFSDVDSALSGLTADLGSLDIDSMMPSPAAAPAGNVRQVVIHNEMGGEHIETLILDVLTGELRRTH